jgi:hypothetical protein
MELTYENMVDHLNKYFDMIPKIDPASDPDIYKKMEKFFSDDFQVRWGTPVKFFNREQWIDHLCGHANEYRALIHYKKSPYYFIVDDRKKMAAGFIREQMTHPESGAIIKDFLINVHFAFTLVHGNAKFKYEMISQIPALYHVDSLTE